jgi:hypothetical protein
MAGTDLRTAAQQALEALEELNGWQSLAPPLASQAGRQAAINLCAAMEQCSCGDRHKDQCPGEWEPGCDLGNNPAFARRVPLEQPNPWRDAVDHELSTLHMVASDDPQESIRRLIDWHCAVQIDPLVSSAAQELIERGRREAMEQDTDCHAQGICQRSGYGIGQTEQEPDRWGAGYEAGYAAGMAEMKPEQAEPVAWMVYTEDGKSAYVTDNPHDLVGAYKAFALYTRPPRRETEQEPVVVNAEALELISEAAEVLDKVRVSCDAWEKYGLRDYLPDELAGTAGMLRDGSALVHPPRRETEQPYPDPAHEYRKGFIDGQIEMRDRPEEQEPVATVMVMGSYNGVPALGCLIDASATHVKRGDRLYTDPPRREWRGLTDEDVEYPHPPAKPPVYATSQNTKAVRDGFVMGGYEKEPGYYSEEQLDEFARAIEAALRSKNT